MAEPVEKLLMNREFPVELWTGIFFFASYTRDPFVCRTRTAVSYVASLDRKPATTKIPCNFHNNNIRRLSARASVIKHVHRFEESIAGRAYLIEVAAVDANRWRASLAHMPGGPTMLMPFYGTTPDAAALQLRTWLLKAYERASQSARPV